MFSKGIKAKLTKQNLLKFEFGSVITLYTPITITLSTYTRTHK